MDKDQEIQFITKTLRALSKENRELVGLIKRQENRINRIEHQVQWNIMHGDFLEPPREMVVRLANGRLGLNIQEEEINNGTD